jgi:hypothetical protein
MENIKNSKGKTLFQGTKQLQSAILERVIDVQKILDEEGNEGKYDEDTLLKNCITEQIEFEKKYSGFETASEVKDFEKSFKLFF